MIGPRERTLQWAKKLRTNPQVVDYQKIILVVGWVLPSLFLPRDCFWELSVGWVLPSFFLARDCFWELVVGWVLPSLVLARDCFWGAIGGHVTKWGKRNDIVNTQRVMLGSLTTVCLKVHVVSQLNWLVGNLFDCHPYRVPDQTSPPSPIEWCFLKHETKQQTNCNLGLALQLHSPSQCNCISWVHGDVLWNGSCRAYSTRVLKNKYHPLLIKLK
jgi:hypothetical protein